MKPLINITSTRGMVRRLAGIQLQLERIADLLEFFLESQGLFIAPKEVEKDDEEILYRDEREEVLAEMQRELKKSKGEKEPEED